MDYHYIWLSKIKFIYLTCSFIYLDRVSPPGLSGAPYVDQVCFELLKIHLLLPLRVLGLKACLVQIVIQSPKTKQKHHCRLDVNTWNVFILPMFSESRYGCGGDEEGFYTDWLPGKRTQENRTS